MIEAVILSDRPHKAVLKRPASLIAPHLLELLFAGGSIAVMFPEGHETQIPAPNNVFLLNCAAMLSLVFRMGTPLRLPRSAGAAVMLDRLFSHAQVA